MWTADRRLYLNAAGQAVEADDPGRASLLVAEGGQIELERAQQLGLVEVTPAEVKAVAPKTNKARAKAPANKAPANKAPANGGGGESTPAE